MRQLVYLSTSVGDYNRARLSRLLNDARAFNAKHQITGVLLCHAGRFAQCLEGPREAIDLVWQRIARAHGHRELVVLQNLPISQRSFADWQMGCTELVAGDWLKLEGQSWTAAAERSCTPGVVTMEAIWQAYQETRF